MQAVTQNLNLEYALTYAREWGFAVFPCYGVTPDGFCECKNQSCKNEGKHPKTAHGVLDATKSERQIKKWFDVDNPPNIGIATGKPSNLIVVDIDSAKGADSRDLMIGGVDQLIFNTPKVKTGAGLHFYYSYPASADIRNSANRLGKFIDVRGDGGYVIAPPSKHLSGHIYKFENDEQSLLEFPKAWIDKLSSPQISQSSPNGNGNSINGVSTAPNAAGIFVPPPNLSGLILPDEIKQGTRNQELTKVAGAMRRNGLSEGAIYSALAVENTRICQPPLDDKELHLIARSVARYKPHEALNGVSDADTPADYENTLKPFLFGEFLREQFEEKEVLGFHIGKRDIAIIQAATNSGKTTLLRNIGLCMAASRPFMPFYEGIRAVKIAYFDFENDAQDVQRDLKIMCGVFSDAELKQLEQNYIVIPKGLMNGELFQFNTHEKWANELIRANGVEFVIVDNVSAAYDLNDENSNAEVTKKVIKPLLKMAYKGDCAFLFAHHYGKAKTELDHAGVHAGRGASALQALSRTVINMFGDVSKGEPVTVECAKRKTDGGQNYRQVFRLEDDRWFHHTTIAPPPKKQTAYSAIRKFMESVVYPQTITLSDLILKFENDHSEAGVRKAVNELYKDGFLERPVHGEYCNKQPKQSAGTKNFYEKDEDED